MDMNTLKKLLTSGQPVLVGWSAIASSYSAEVLASTGFDTVVVDMQHALATDENLYHCMQAVRAGGSIPMARVRWNEPASIMRALDLGAMGIICPMINNKADGQAFVSACRYSPRGNRSYGPVGAGVAYGADYYQNANDSVVTMAMIETVEAVKNVEDIVTIEELDGLFIGPNDLGVDLGEGPVLDQPNDALDNAIAHIVKVAHGAGKFVGIFGGSADGARRRIGQGCNFVSLANDGMYIRQASAQAYKAIKDVKNTGKK